MSTINSDACIKVLIVDDSAIVGRIFADAVSAESDMRVVGTAADPYIARDKILALRPDVLTLDIEMPRMDGLTFLKKLMHYHPLPVVVVSSLVQASCQVTLEALRLGAVDVLAKPGGAHSVGELRLNLVAKIRAAARARVRPPIPAPPSSDILAPLPEGSFGPRAIIAIGASTGGTEAIQDLLTRMPPGSPGIVITQHIPASFSLAFANRLNQVCSLEVKEACDGDVLASGLALVAPGNLHMLVRRSADGYRVQVKDGVQVCYQRPSVDVLFSSVAQAAGNLAIGVLLTGMGSDGAQGLLRMKRAGARTIVQDEASCVVFGMPKEAIRLGAADCVLPLHRIPPAIITNKWVD